MMMSRLRSTGTLIGVCPLPDRSSKAKLFVHTVRFSRAKREQKAHRVSPLVAVRLPKPVEISLQHQAFGKVKKRTAEILDWCQLFLPLAVFACASFLFRGAFVQDALPHTFSNPHSAMYAGVSRSVSEIDYTWGDVIQYRFQKVFSQQRVISSHGSALLDHVHADVWKALCCSFGCNSNCCGGWNQLQNCYGAEI